MGVYTEKAQMLLKNIMVRNKDTLNIIQSNVHSVIVFTTEIAPRVLKAMPRSKCLKNKFHLSEKNPSIKYGLKG